ncbi:mitogen-activated protein kinase kinase kinase 17-like [Vigna radiata var. radiata]|uniref:Mitogen-activated protein kinase kinase kinase 17-like n=1 Tax=Vigna radiata var. radiata TaxID=3916 RepID=A0A1S3VAK0_VIGRR|nr:mitogen-activated protein kinase kinase kinase 17-like [Vigna radiata var. radiata]
MAGWKKLRVLGEGSYGTVYLVLLRSTQEQNSKLSLLALKTSNLIKTEVLSQKEVIVYTHMLLKGLSYMHEKGITSEEANTDLGGIKFRGTPYYMSPESVRGFKETPLDIWSLGCIVIEMSTGLREWWNIESTNQLLCKLAFSEEVPKIPDKLSYDCKDFLRKCLMNDPQQRWTAKMLLNHPFIQKKYSTS